MDSVDFAVWLDILRKLPSDAPQWEQASQFAERLTLIIAEKEQERARTSELLQALTEIGGKFSGELDFLGINAETELRITSTPPDDIQSCLAAVSNVEGSLIELKEARSTTFDRLQIAAESVQRHVDTLKELLAGAESAIDETEHADVLRPSDPTEEAHLAASAHNADSQMEEEAVGASTEVESECESPIEAYEQTDDGKAQEESASIHPDDAPNEENILPDSSSHEDQHYDELTGKNDLEEGFTLKETSVPEDSQETLRPHGIEESAMAAKHYLKSSSLEDLENLLWSLIAEDDLSGAYWVAEYLFEKNHRSTILPELVKALLGSRSLSPDSNRYVADLFDVASKYENAEASGAQGLLELAASIYPSLIAPHSSMLGLLQTPTVFPVAGVLVAAVNEFARFGDALRPEYIKGAGESARRQDEIMKASALAGNWLEDAPKRKYSSLMWATNVWKHLTGANGKISELLSAVIDDDRTEANFVKERTDEWTQDVATDDINQINQFLAEGKTPRPPITGRARNWLLNGIEEAKSIALHWCELVQYESEVKEGAQESYLVQRVDELRNEMRQHADKVVQSLSELTTDANPMEIACAARCALRSLEQVFTSLDIDVDHNLPDVPVVVERMRHINSDSQNLRTSMARRLMWTRNIAMDDEGVWVGDGLEQVMRDLAESTSESMSQEATIEQRLRIQDYRFFDIMSAGVSPEGKERLKGLYRRSRQDSDATLKKYVEEIKNGKDQAVRDGVIDIDDDNWIMYGLIVADIENAIESDEEILNYPSRTGQLDQVRGGLEAEERRRRAQLQGEWNEEFSDLSENAGSAVVAWQEKFSAARKRGNIRVMEECVIRLRNHSLGEPLPDPGSSDEVDDIEGNAISEFVAFVDRISDIEEYARTSIGLTSLESRLTSI